MSCDTNFLKLSCIASSVWSLLFIIFTLQCRAAFDSKRAYICEFQTGEYKCNNLPHHISSKIDVPPMACLIHDCQQYIRTNKTYLLTEEYELLMPSKFILRPMKSLNTFENLNNATELVAVAEEYTLINPTRLVFEMCLLDKRHSHKRPDEGYLAPALRRNYPQAGHIGAIQANTSYTKFFIFDPEITKCDFFEDTLRCHSAQDPVDQLKTTKEYALPIQRDMHLFHIQDGKLASTMLSTAAVKIQLSFSNFKIAVKTVMVCPLFSSDQFVAAGCYNCPLLARIIVTTHSTCQAGVAFVDFKDNNVHTKVLRLQMEPATHTIKFLAIRKCYNEKLYEIKIIRTILR